MQKEFLNKSWIDLFLDDNISESFKDYIAQFFMPNDIDPEQYFVNEDAISQPFRYTLYENNPKFSKTLKKLLENADIEKTFYPDWFYCSFPDVIDWSISKSDGINFMLKLVAEVGKEKLVEGNNGDLLEEYLLELIENYKSNNKLECSI